MMAKLDIYRKFTNAMAVAVIVSVGWICYEVIFVWKVRVVHLVSVLCLDLKFKR